MVNQSEYRDSHCSVDFGRQALEVDSRHVALTRKEWELLATLVGNRAEIVPRAVLLESIWGYGPDIRTRTLDVHVRRLRKKLGSYGEQYIETIFGVGYRFQPYHDQKPFSEFAHVTAA